MALLCHPIISHVAYPTVKAILSNSGLNWALAPETAVGHDQLPEPNVRALTT